MRNLVVLFVLLLALKPWATAQKLYPLQAVADSLAFRLAVSNRLPALQWQSNTGALLGVKRGDYPVVTAIFWRESDLVVQYTPGRATADRSFSIELALELANGSRIQPQQHELAAAPASDARALWELVWLDALEQLPNFEETYVLHLRRTMMGAVNCAGERPHFTLKKQLPHYALAGAGVALLGFGQVYNQQKKDAYAQYRRYWADGKSRPEADDPFLATARDKKKAAAIATYTGLALIGADALWYAFRAKQINRRQKNYDRFCIAPPATSSLQVRPALLPSGMLPGCGLSLTFSISRP